MKKFFVFLLFNFCFQIIHAEYIALDSLNINDACIYRQKVIMHVESNVMSDEKIVVFEFAKKDTLYIGDTNVDYEVATNSGVDYILVSYGYRKKDLLIELDRRSVIVDRIEQLLDKF